MDLKPQGGNHVRIQGLLVFCASDGPTWYHKSSICKQLRQSQGLDEADRQRPVIAWWKGTSELERADKSFSWGAGWLHSEVCISAQLSERGVLVVNGPQVAP